MRKFLTSFAGILVLMLALMMGAGMSEAVTKFVTPGGAGEKNGSSWANAMSSVELVKFLDAHDEKSNVDIWVAKGTYSPGNTKEATFNLKKGIEIYGGFDGDETILEQRDWVNNITILSGDAGGKGNENYHVVSSYGLQDDPDRSPTSKDTRIDGFTITGGFASAKSGNDGLGGGMFLLYSSPTIENCTAVKNMGNLGAGAFEVLHSSPVIKNCTFKDNTTATPGGALGSPGGAIRYHHGPEGGLLIIDGCAFESNISMTAGAIKASGGGSSKIKIVNSVFRSNAGGAHAGALHISKLGFEIENCTFTDNNSVFGGAIYTAETSGTITNSTFSGNNGATVGGAIATHRSTFDIVNCTFAENISEKGGAMALECGPYANIAMTNSIFWGNKATISGDAIFLAHEDPDLHTEETVLALTNNVIKSADVVVEPWTYNYITVLSRDLVNSDPLIASYDIEGNPATKSADVYIYELSVGSPAIGKGLAVGKNTITFLKGETRDITVPAFDQLHAPRPNPVKGTSKAADIGAEEYYDHSKATGIVLTPIKADLHIGGIEHFEARYTPEGTWGGPLRWTSASDDIAFVAKTVAMSAIAYGTSAGTTKIEARTRWITPVIFKSADITVHAPNATGITITPSSKKVSVGGTADFEIKFTPEGSYGGPVEWTSSKPAVADIMSDTHLSAHVLGFSGGETSITATALWSSDISGSATLTVDAPQGGGCSAAYAPFALLFALVPFVLRKRQ